MKSNKIDFNAVNRTISENIEKFLDYFGLDYVSYQNRVSMSCPIHTSSKSESLSVFTTGDNSVGNFVCWTHHCESEVGRGAINLIVELLKVKNGKGNLIRLIVSSAKTSLINILILG